MDDKALDKNFLKTFSREKWCLKPIHAVESAALLRIKNQAALPIHPCELIACF
jgi:hypothetical protein